MVRVKKIGHKLTRSSTGLLSLFRCVTQQDIQIFIRFRILKSNLIQKSQDFKLTVVLNFMNLQHTNLQFFRFAQTIPFSKNFLSLKLKEIFESLYFDRVSIENKYLNKNGCNLFPSNFHF